MEPSVTEHVRPVRRSRPGIASCCGLFRRWNASPPRQKFLLGDRIRSTALDILESLIEAACIREREGHLVGANLGIEKLRFLVRLARDLRFLDSRRYEHAARVLDETGRKVGAWRKTHRARRSG